MNKFDITYEIGVMKYGEAKLCIFQINLQIYIYLEYQSLTLYFDHVPMYD